MPVERRAPGAAQDSLHGPATARKSTRRAPSLRHPPTDHRRARSPLWNGSAVHNHLAVMSWRHIYGPSRVSWCGMGTSLPDLPN